MLELKSVGVAIRLADLYRNVTVEKRSAIIPEDEGDGAFDLPPE